MRIIQLDEFVITKKTWQTHAWTQQRDNIQIDQTKAFKEMSAVVLAISREMGVDYVSIHDKSINKLKFKMFLEGLRAKYPFDDIILQMDNISFHKSWDIKERMDELGFHYTYTPAYSPKYNGIEEVIGIGKRVVKKRRLEMITNNIDTPLR